MAITDALRDPRLLAGSLGVDLASWFVWFIVLKAAFAIGLDAAELATFQEVAGGRLPPARLVRELWIIAGRRSGKSRIAALIAVYLSIFSKYRLSAGERGVVLIVAPSIAQTKIVFDYAVGAITASPTLSKAVEEITQTEIRLHNRVTITCAASVPRTLRGRSMIAVVMDEAAHLRDEGVASDADVYRAVAPALGASGGLLIGISTPHRRAGLVFERHSRCFGKDDPDVLVVQAASRVLNPCLDEAMIEAQRASDPVSAASEWDASSFRSDIDPLLPDEVIDGAVDGDRPVEIPPVTGTVYRAFVDVGGSGASEFSLALGHRDVARGKLVVDVVRSVSPPYNVIETVAAYAALCRQYRVGEICGDHYGGGWPADCWRDVNIKYLRCTATKSELYIEATSSFLRGLVSLPNMPRLVTQLRQLERRTHASGRDTVDSGKHRDDLANVTCGLLHELVRRRGFLDETGWMDKPAEEDKVTNKQWEHPADKRQREMLDRVRQPPSMVPPDLLAQQLGLSDPQYYQVVAASENIWPQHRRREFQYLVLDKLADRPSAAQIMEAIKAATAEMKETTT
jgi:hypothetical protein